MRASTEFWLGGGVCCLLLGSLSGCHKEVKADFPRPPATAAVPAPEPPPETAETPPVEEPEAPPGTQDEPPQEPESPPKPVAAVKRPRANPEPDPVEPAATEPTSTQISGTGTGQEDPEIVAKLRRVDALFESLGDRKLTAEQAQQLTAAESFVTQARKAMEEGDPRRALVLIDKGLILAQDLERLSRP